MPEYVPQAGEAVVEQVKEKVRRPPMFRVLMHNDDYTPMDFVVRILRSIFGKPEAEAVRIMLQIHHRGIGMCGVYTQEIAETKIAQVHDEARENGHPLMCSMEPAD